ncbi:MAG: TlpA family protein disulfide reductase [Planctomycetes bacterium]|nr:TlpA family protein disulfide reductase [Planctomycetota bacterium]
MIAALIFALAQVDGALPETQAYTAWLVCPGGHIRFGLELARTGPETWRAFLVNGEERIEVPRVERKGDQLLLDMPHYDSRITATVSEPSGSALTGTWEKRRDREKVAQLPFHARVLSSTGPWRTPSEQTPLSGADVTGRWTARFEGEDETSIAVLRQDGSRLTGTFLTPTGDYRFLVGGVQATPVESQEMQNYLTTFTLSCFDGAHAFLFAGRYVDGKLWGDFWSGNWHHQTWKAERDESAQLADAFAQTKWNGTTKLADLTFPDLDGRKHSLSEFAGKATLLVVLGSWCPNCNDEAKLLAELDAKYRARGLRILGLAFELTGERERDAGQVRIFAQRHGLEIPFFLCGTADKDEATKALGLVDRVRAFPTTVFVGADGLPRAIHSGFAGPATGVEHQKLRREFQARIEALLGPK